MKTFILLLLALVALTASLGYINYQYVTADAVPASITIDNSGDLGQLERDE